MKRIKSKINTQLWYEVYAATQRIPPGTVATYADVARAIGRPRAWRHVGTVLGMNRDPATPCHRVIRSDGFVGGFGMPGSTREKVRRLCHEGVAVTAERVDLRRYRIPSPRILRA